MFRFTPSRLALVSLVVASPALLLAACSSDPGTGDGGGGTGNTSATGGFGNPGGGFPGGGNNPGGGFPGAGTAGIGSGGTPGAGTGGVPGAGTGGASAGTAGIATAGTAGTGTPATSLCSTKSTAPAMLTNFETYDGTVPAYGTGGWVHAFVPGAYLGLYTLSEETAPVAGDPNAYALIIGAGADASLRAAAASDKATTNWGGGIGLWMGCMDASAFSGLTFSARGTTPTMRLAVSVNTEQGTAPNPADPGSGGTCVAGTTPGGCGSHVAEVTLAPDWTTITVPFSMLIRGGTTAPTPLSPADRITGMSFQSVMVYNPPVPPAPETDPWTAAPGAFDIAVDNIGFTP